MERQNKQLVIEQLDKKLKKYEAISLSDIPGRGWLYTIRTALGMSLRQLAKRLNKTVPTLKEIEEREVNKNITLKKLSEVANVLEMQLVYALVPKGLSIEKMIESRAHEIASQIVLGASHTMELEDQRSSNERLNKAIADQAQKIKREMPRYLWD